MGDMGYTYNALRQHQKERRKNNETYWKSKIENVGAKYLTEGVYRLGDCEVVYINFVEEGSQPEE